MTRTEALLATDLDRTMIYSRRFLDDPSHAVCVEVYKGEPISFMSPGAATRLAAVADAYHVVPATTRTVEQFRRVQLPGAPYRHAVTSNGGTILCDGVPDVTWSATIASRIAETSVPLAEVSAALQARIGDDWVRSFRVAEDLFCYLVVDEESLPIDFMPQWKDWCAPRGWVVSRQGRKIYSVPSSLCKSRAVAEVRHRLIEGGELAPSARLLAAGDGALDIGLLESADVAIRPSHGELHALGWTAPTLAVTGTAGAGAAEVMLDWFSERAVKKLSHGERALQ